jgi:hypothetical protein
LNTKSLARVLLIVALCIDANGQNRSDHRAIPINTMFTMLDEIDRAQNLSPARAGEFLKVTLQLEPDQTNEYLYIYKGHRGLWTDVELRLPRGGDGRRFVLVLEPNVSIPMSEIKSHYDVLAFGSPNPSAGKNGMFSYVYDRQVGKLTFSFPSFEEPFAKVILFDRM